MRMVTVAYYSYTGNTRKVACVLKQALEAEGEAVELLDLVTHSLSQTQTQHLILLYAIHAFNAPQAIITQIKELKSSPLRFIHFIGVGCQSGIINRGASLPLRKLAMKKKIEVGLDRLIAMPLTLVVGFSEEMKQQLLETMQNEVTAIVHDFKSEQAEKHDVKSAVKVLRYIGQLEKYGAKLFGLELYANKSCVACGRCYEQCPMSNISANRYGKPKFHFNCSMCLKCIYQCPKQAISPRLSKFIIIKEGYHLD